MSQLALYGGSPVRTENWPTYEDGTSDFDREIELAVMSVLHSGRLFRYDSRPYAETCSGQLERSLASYFGSKYALALSSGTAALSVTLMSLGLRPDSKVACPAFGFPATASAIICAGCKPVIVGVDDNLHFDLNSLQNLEDIDAVVVVHMRGFASEIDRINEYCKENALPLVEDVVPALGVTYNGRFLGTYGIAGCFSTQSDKTINTGEGGFLITNDRRLIEKAVLYSGAYEGRCLQHIPELSTPLSEVELPLYNFRIDEIRSSIALCQLSRIRSKIEKLQSHYNYVSKKLQNNKAIRLREPVVSDGYLGDALVIFVQNASSTDFAKALRAEGIAARSFAETDPPNIRAFWNWEFATQGWKSRIDSNEADGLAKSVSTISSAVDIPLSVSLSTADLDDAVEAIEKVAYHFGKN